MIIFGIPRISVTFAPNFKKKIKTQKNEKISCCYSYYRFYDLLQ